MKKNMIYGSVVTILGLFIALGPQFLFKVCSPAMMSTGAVSSNVSTESCGGAGDSCCSGDVVSSCGSSEGGCGCSSKAAISYPACHWSAQALIGLGFLITALGLCLLIFNDLMTQLGLFIGVFMSSIITLSIPHALIGGCKMMTMACRKAAFPAITVIGIVLLILSAVYVVYTRNKTK